MKLQIEKMRKGEIQKLPRKPSAANNVKMTVRISQETKEAIAEYAARNRISLGDVVELTFKSFKETN